MSTFQMPSEISVLKTKAASQKGAGGTNVQAVWLVPKFGASTTLNDPGGDFGEYVVPAGSMFTLGAALPKYVQPSSFSDDADSWCVLFKVIRY
ncbi:hypothetical protein I314_06621 [Cryptococcus bacillisporus CA1873]|uniref:Uncharacterized protein n=1 Tax=Cryptococcus bacillisporus CA1873 TaxID=1296111 RepID=A0ABR5B2J9_CRYGA|nr:hypothetical protein I314_06621 [Cryptococcus bacillisporus CA1873]|eukprot:KIR57589.1 hypothetical protein I314_06621 [Cryptococcus gattii CA1873]